VTFGPDEIREYKLGHAAMVCLHRVNECDARKGTSFMDDLLAGANTVADFTVFVSAWLRDYHAARWFDARRPHAVIQNGADPAAFHPLGGEGFTGATPFRLVTHHWSDNWMKGFDVYQAVDELIASGRLPDTELWVVGRWPREIRWKVAHTIGPAHGVELGSLLRRCHAYLTASRFDPGPMHPIEGVQCGLPLIYHQDGGGIVELGLRYGVGFRDDVRAAIVEARERYAELRGRVLADVPPGDRMCVDYGRIILRLLAAGAADRARGSSP
jgi:glycosyltransferase involved in cell wall biosynthesis